MTGVLVKQGNLNTEADTHRGKMMERDEEKTAIYKSKNSRGCQKPGERPGTDPSLVPSEEAQ